MTWRGDFFPPWDSIRNKRRNCYVLVHSLKVVTHVNIYPPFVVTNTRGHAGFSPVCTDRWTSKLNPWQESEERINKVHYLSISQSDCISTDKVLFSLFTSLLSFFYPSPADHQAIQFPTLQLCPSISLWFLADGQEMTEPGKGHLQWTTQHPFYFHPTSLQRLPPPDLHEDRQNAIGRDLTASEFSWHCWEWETCTHVMEAPAFSFPRGLLFIAIQITPFVYWKRPSLSKTNFLKQLGFAWGSLVFCLPAFVFFNFLHTYCPFSNCSTWISQDLCHRSQSPKPLLPVDTHTVLQKGNISCICNYLFMAAN